MSANEPTLQAAPAAQLQWDRTNTPRSLEFDDIYYSADSGLEESRHVFLVGNDLPEAWRRRPRFTVAEIGFGTGLNFLATWQAWLEDADSCAYLHYLAFEKYPVRVADMQRALSAWPQLQDQARQLLSNYPPPLPGRHRLSFEQGRILLDLVFADARVALTDLQAEPSTRVNCWYLDGFAPARNPDMWQPGLYAAMAILSQPNTTFATFTAAGQVRRDLQDAGFEVKKTAGYGSKREMLRGRYRGPERQRVQTTTPWHIAPPVNDKQRTAMVLGAGLAGATAASALARRGWRVQVLERDEVAGAASGMLQGVLYTRISHRVSDLNAFSLHSFCFASRMYRDMLHSGLLRSGQDGELCGALHLRPDWDKTQPLQATLASMPELARYLDSAQATALCGLDQCPAGLFFPDGGWMHPAAVCRALLQHPAIRLTEHSNVKRLQYDGAQWLALNGQGEELQRARVAVVASGASCRAFEQLQWLPTQAIRGQVSHLASNGPLASLRTVICHDGYIAPALGGIHCIGATFGVDDPDPTPRPADHQENLEKLRAALPQLELPDPPPEQLAGQVGYRCASPDYLPMVGPVPDLAAFVRDYADLRKNARRYIDATPSYLPGLYLSTAHGSRGLTSTPLAAELLAAQISDQPWPLDSQLCRALSPVRFIVRDLIRNRI